MAEDRSASWEVVGRAPRRWVERLSAKSRPILTAISGGPRYMGRGEGADEAGRRLGGHFRSSGRGPTRAAWAVVLWLADLRKKEETPKTSQVNALAEDENYGSLGNGGDSDPAETTVGKLAIS